MQISRSGDEKHVCFTITGSLSGTANSTVKLFEEVSAAIEHKPAEIALDLTRAMYVDSMSIGLLVGILLKGRERGVGIRLVNVSAPVRSMLDAVKLKTVFPELY